MVPRISLLLLSVMLLVTAAAVGADTGPQPSLPTNEVKTVTGKAWSISTRSERVTVLHFWSLHCRPCLAALPRLRRLHGRWEQGSGIALVGLPVEDDLIQIRRHVRRHRMTWSQLTHAEGSALPVLAGPLGVKEMPTPYFWIVDPNGRIIATSSDPETAGRLAEECASRRLPKDGETPTRNR